MYSVRTKPFKNPDEASHQVYRTPQRTMEDHHPPLELDFSGPCGIFCDSPPSAQDVEACRTPGISLETLNTQKRVHWEMEVPFIGVIVCQEQGGEGKPCDQ